MLENQEDPLRFLRVVRRKKRITLRKKRVPWGQKKPFFRIKRVIVGEGCFVPEDHHFHELEMYAKTLAQRKKRALIGVKSNLVDVVEFEGHCRMALANVVNHYPIFRNKSDFERLVKTSMQNRLQDYVRNIFRKKRFGIDIPIVAQEPEEEVIGLNGLKCTGITEERLVESVVVEENSYLEIFKDRLSKKAFNLYWYMTIHPDEIRWLKKQGELKPYFKEIRLLLEKLNIIRKTHQTITPTPKENHVGHIPAVSRNHTGRAPKDHLSTV